ncbi:MAG: hypothetical protein OXU68_02455, partial [Bacteroidota bacterium]|nr:hypothetical protein [Bacteroidota bacterium]
MACRVDPANAATPERALNAPEITYLDRGGFWSKTAHVVGSCDGAWNTAGDKSCLPEKAKFRNSEGAAA